MFNTMKFEDFLFEPIDLTLSGKPDIHITQLGITFTRKLIEDMGYPQYVEPMINMNSKVFAIKVCEPTNEHAIRFSKAKNEQKTALVTSNSAIRKFIRSIMGDKWNDENRYHITGFWYADAKAMVFDLNTAKELQPYIVRKNM